MDWIDAGAEALEAWENAMRQELEDEFGSIAITTDVTDGRANDTGPTTEESITTNASTTGATTTTDTTTNDDVLAVRIQKLAQELQDLILDFKLAIKPDTVHINRHYRPPWPLIINRRTRKTVAKAYYRDCKFEWAEADSYKLAKRWLDSMPADHRVSFTEVRIKRERHAYAELESALYCVAWAAGVAQQCRIPYSSLRTNVYRGGKVEWLSRNTIVKIINQGPSRRMSSDVEAYFATF